MDGVYIFDQTGRTLLEFTVMAVPTVDEVLPLVTMSQEGAENSPLIELTPSQLVYRRKYGQLVIIVPCETGAQPLMVEAFVDKLIVCIETYFEEKLTAQLVDANQATLVLLLFEMLGVGLPSTTEPDILKSLIPTNNLLDALWSSGKPNQPGWNLRWRRQGISYSKNQVYVDIVESLQVVVPAHSQSRRRKTKLLAGSAYYSTNSKISSRPQICRVRGQIKINSRLSGEPVISLQLGGDNTRVPFTSISFHPSVDYSQWESRGVLGFTPPDGPSVIAEYTLDIADQGLVYAEILREMGTERNEFEVRVSTNMDTMVEFVQDLVITLVFPSETTNVKELRLTSGDLDASNARRAGWSFGPKTPVGWNATLRGQASKENGSVQPLYATVTYKTVGRIPSKITVSNLSISNFPGQDRPYRGVRYQTLVDNFTIR